MEKEYIVCEIEMKTISPVISGEIKEFERNRKREQGIHLPCRITGDNKVAVPIYGALRGYTEITLRASGEKVCDTGLKGRDGAGCGMCVLCDLYGYLGRRGRVFIDDLVSEKSFDTIVKKATHIKMDREKGAVTDTLVAEEIEEGAIFKGKLMILNPKEKDLELINTGIVGINQFGLGGWLTRGRGRVELKIVKVSKKKFEDLKKEAGKIASELLKR